jgi:hypothetical protein
LLTRAASELFLAMWDNSQTHFKTDASVICSSFRRFVSNEVTHMCKSLAISSVLTCAMMLVGLQDVLAQAPPRDGDVLIWSNRDLSLRSNGFAASPETETSFQLPRIDLPGSSYDGRHGQVLICEPGQFGFTDPATAAYAQAGKPQDGGRR